MPSSVPVGGMRMSVTTTSGASSSTRSRSSSYEPATPATDEVVLGLEQPDDRFADQVAVVSDDDAGHGELRRRRHQ